MRKLRAEHLVYEVPINYKKYLLWEQETLQVLAGIDGIYNVQAMMNSLLITIHKEKDDDALWESVNNALKHAI